MGYLRSDDDADTAEVGKGLRDVVMVRGGG